MEAKARAKLFDVINQIAEESELEDREIDFITYLCLGYTQTEIFDISGHIHSDYFYTHMKRDLMPKLGMNGNFKANKIVAYVLQKVLEGEEC